MSQLALFVQPNKEHCDEIAHPDLANFVISILLVIGILGSYIPQHVKIIRKRSSAGLSPYFVLLGGVSGTCAIANVLVLPTSREDIACCKINSAFSCAAGLLGIAQIATQFGCFFLITFLFLIFIPREPVLNREGHEVGQVPKADYAWQQGLAVFGTSIFFLLAVFIVSVVMVGAFPHHLQRWANLLGLGGAALACIQYLPQLYMTWTSRQVGSLSIGMMCIQTPGSFVFVASLAARLGWVGWSTWLVYAITGILQGILLSMALYFTSENKRLASARALNDDEDANERDPLLPARPE